MHKAKILRKLMKEKNIIIAPGAFDTLSARLIEQAGFSAVYVSGAGIASSRLGVPDIVDIGDVHKNIS